jgi:predicted glycoside hydrolase/deacetylase ChbG (UPF0249 family)
MNSRSIILAAALMIGGLATLFSQENIATALGFHADTKLLIIHADDLGVSHSENTASIKAMEEGSVNSASVMMPTPWVMEIAHYAQLHPDTHDFGLHLTLSSEWKYYKWGPVSSKDKVPTLIDKHGYFHEGCRPDIAIEEAESELRAQIERAYAMGLVPTHLDSHMGCLLWQSAALLETYLKLGQAYNLPVLALPDYVTPDLKEKYNVKVIADEVFTITPEEYEKGAEAYYTNVIKNIKPGLSVLLIHTAYDNEEMKGMNIDHPNWGNEWRQKDFDFFTSDACKELLKEEQIELVTWRQLKEAFY